MVFTFPRILTKRMTPFVRRYSVQQSGPNAAVVQEMLSAWENQDVETFVNHHTEDFAFNFCPNDIPSLRHVTGTHFLGRAGLANWNQNAWGPRNPMLPTGKPEWKDFAEVNDKVYANALMPVSFFGTDPIEMNFFFCFTMRNNQISFANINGDLTGVAQKISNLEEKNMRAIEHTFGLFGMGDIHGLVDMHTKDCTWSFLPSQIPALNAFTGPAQGEVKLQKHFSLWMTPGSPFEPAGPPSISNMRALGNKVFATMRMDMRSLGQGPVPMEFEMKWTLEGGLIADAKILADTTELANLHN
jgi:hypothetical protein